jgi:hypothetical protein
VFQLADPKFVNQGSVDRCCCLMSEAGRTTPSPWCSGCTTGRRITVAEPTETNPVLPTYGNVSWEKTTPRLKTGGSAIAAARRVHVSGQFAQPIRCAKNHRLRRGKCVASQNCGKNAYRNVGGDCH